MAAVLSECVLTKMVQHGPNDHVGQDDLILNRVSWVSTFARPKWAKMDHFGLKRSMLVHLGPPTVLWPFSFSEDREWGVGSVVVESGVFGAPRFSVQRS